MTTESIHPHDDDLPEGAIAGESSSCQDADPQDLDQEDVRPEVSEAPPLTPEQEATILRGALAEANEEIARQADAVQRGLADLANARRRHDEERITIQRQANSRLLVQLLPIVDELDLAIGHLDSNGPAASGESASDSWTEGVRLIQRKMVTFLESQGVARIDAMGEPFNPELHEAVGMAHVADAESGSVVEVLRQGYRLHDRVVQVAQVVVNQ